MAARKPAKVPKAWRREDGRYRSADDRFTIEGGGAGRWFVTDDEALDELGLARTMGPFATLDDAKTAAALQREQGSEPSPLAARIAAPKGRPGRASTTRRAGTRPRASTRRADKPSPRDAGSGEAADPGQAAVPRTWLDDLEDEDRAAASRARRIIRALESVGVDDADGVVRRDVLGRQPAVATRLLGRTLANALRSALDPQALGRDAAAAIPTAMRELRAADDDALAAYAAIVARRVLAATLEAVTSDVRADGAAADLPGWTLVERTPARDPEDRPPRRIILAPEDVAGG